MGWAVYAFGSGFQRRMVDADEVGWKGLDVFWAAGDREEQAGMSEMGVALETWLRRLFAVRSMLVLEKRH